MLHFSSDASDAASSQASLFTGLRPDPKNSTVGFANGQFGRR
jgi:hypothetical protein